MDVGGVPYHRASGWSWLGGDLRGLGTLNPLHDRLGPRLESHTQ